MALVQLTDWKPWDIKKLIVRDRRFWVKWYQAIEERKIMDAVTKPA